MIQIEWQIGTVTFTECPNGCWRWEGRLRGKTPVLPETGRSLRHLVWKTSRSDVQKGQRVRNVCGNDRCCNPDHQELVFNSTGRGWAKGPKTHWFQGNEKGCWLWTGKHITHGYGYVMIEGQKQLTHVRVYELSHGPVPRLPNGRPMSVMHLCDEPACVRPDHLRMGTQRDNSRDMAAKLRGPNKLTYAQADEMRALRATGMPFRIIARQFNVTHRTVMKVCTGKTYVPPPTRAHHAAV